jgi:hypothetical protein
VQVSSEFVEKFDLEVKSKACKGCTSLLVPVQIDCAARIDTGVFIYAIADSWSEKVTCVVSVDFGDFSAELKGETS